MNIFFFLWGSSYEYVIFNHCQSQMAFELGMGDLSGFMDRIHKAIPADQQPKLLQNLSIGNVSLRVMYEQFHSLLNLGPINEVINYVSLTFYLYYLYLMCHKMLISACFIVSIY